MTTNGRARSVTVEFIPASRSVGRIARTAQLRRSSPCQGRRSGGDGRPRRPGRAIAASGAHGAEAPTAAGSSVRADARRAPAPLCRSASRSAQAGSPGPCEIATVAESPGRSSAQCGPRSTAIRIGTRWVTLVNSPELTSRGTRAKLAPVARSTQTTRPSSGPEIASIQIRAGLPGEIPSQPLLLHVGRDVDQLRVVEAQHRRADRRVVARVAEPADDDAVERGDDLRVLPAGPDGLLVPGLLHDLGLPVVHLAPLLLDLQRAELGQAEVLGGLEQEHVVTST